MRICKNCGFHAEHQEKFCPRCGAEIVDGIEKNKKGFFRNRVIGIVFFLPIIIAAGIFTVWRIRKDESFQALTAAHDVDKKNADTNKSEEKERPEETVKSEETEEPEETVDPKEATELTEPVEAKDLDSDPAPASEENTPNIQVPDVETAATMMGIIEDSILGQTKSNIDEMFGEPISSDDYNIFTYDGSYMIDEGGRLKAYFVEARAYRVDYLFGGSSASDFTEDMTLQALINMYGRDYTEMVNDAQQIEYDWNFMDENKTQGSSKVKLVPHGDPAGLSFEIQWFAIG